MLPVLAPPAADRAPTTCPSRHAITPSSHHPPTQHAFLVQQQRLRRITSAALVLECTPEAFRLDPQQHLRPLLACLEEFGLSQARSGVLLLAGPSVHECSPASLTACA